jgi:predicted nucleotidyltransferase
MIQMRPNELAQVRQILRELAPTCEARVFGSRFKGTATVRSDLDLALVGKGKLGFSKLGDIRYAFQESDLPFRVDVLDLNAVSDNFRAIVERGYEVI